MDVWTYFEQKLREFEDYSLAPDREPDDMFVETAGSEGKRGRVFGNLFLTEGVYLRISEVVVVRGNRIHREEYAYFLVVDGYEAWGWERDLSHDPAVHRHATAAHTRVAARPIPFKKVVDLAWEEVSRRASNV